MDLETQFSILPFFCSQPWFSQTSVGSLANGKKIILCNFLPANEGGYSFPTLFFLVSMIPTTLIFALFWVELVLWRTLCLSLVKTNVHSQILIHGDMIGPKTAATPVLIHLKNKFPPIQSTVHSNLRQQRDLSLLCCLLKGFLRKHFWGTVPTPTNLPIVETQKGIIKWSLLPTHHWACCSISLYGVPNFLWEC